MSHQVQNINKDIEIVREPNGNSGIRIQLLEV